MCTGLLDGKSALAIQMEHPAYQIFNLTNFLINVSHLQSKLGLESTATVTFSSPHVVPSHSPPPSFVQAHPCLESQQVLSCSHVNHIGTRLNQSRFSSHFIFK